MEGASPSVWLGAFVARNAPSEFRPLSPRLVRTAPHGSSYSDPIFVEMLLLPPNLSDLAAKFAKMIRVHETDRNLANKIAVGASQRRFSSNA